MSGVILNILTRLLTSGEEDFERVSVSIKEETLSTACELTVSTSVTFSVTYLTIASLVTENTEFVISISVTLFSYFTYFDFNSCLELNIKWYEQFLQVGRLNRALILLSLAIYLPSTSVSSVFVMLYILQAIYFLVTFFSLPFSELAWWDWPLTQLTNHCP